MCIIANSWGRQRCFSAILQKHVGMWELLIAVLWEYITSDPAFNKNNFKILAEPRLFI